MIQHHFKKDSRVWLHKNSKRKCYENEWTKYRLDFYNNRHDNRNPYEEEDLDNASFITGADGRVYKKDSRTWLHKSSDRSDVNCVRDESTLNTKLSKNPRRMWDVMKRVKTKIKMKELATKDRIDTVRAQDSSELIRGVINTGKRKKNALRSGRNCLASISQRDIHILDECEEANFHSYNHSNDKRPRFRFVKGSYSDPDNTNGESSSDSDDSNEEIVQTDHRKQRILRRLCECPMGHQRRHMAINCNGCDSLPLCRSNASIQLTQDGINAVREIATEMQLQSGMRSSYVVGNQDVSLIQDDPNANPLDLTTGGLYSSKSSLNMCDINLSDECVTALEDVPDAESDYQLSEATRQGLNVKSPNTNQFRQPTEPDDSKIMME